MALARRPQAKKISLLSTTLNPAPPRSDEDGARMLEERALAGDRQAWGALIQRYNRRIMVSLLAFGMPPAQAEELAHDTWVRLMDKQQRGVLKSLRLPGLALTLARNLACDQYRRRSSHERSLSEADLIGLATGGAGPEALASEREQLHLVYRALSRCSYRQQQIFHLRYRDHQTREEIADKLDLSLQRVSQSLAELRTFLRSVMERH